ncbi:glutathione S-transferase family protein [Methylobacterium haplocladii]|uniref:Glutathione S-transferase n=1 Tax=Methylobacterium haplocladii TaxID=1176176 RepID=A0A512IQC6_9HYPH|nr:glutathione S-transferase family protein [Methylobacterium haplocladii]GEO99923.1 glutathione S-transferase [Methylobacterium haplocladii]GJD85228.1 Glutathione S-transferase GST-6.0 [Methylobacterium haplocladii]GLS60982.1 glutathione S-transferase [Methylobacterium haplocladii]
MTDELVFYTHPMSRGRIVRWMLEEVGAPYRTEILDFGGSAKSPDYLAINPMGKVPTVTHGGSVVTECPAILAYLADAFPDAGLAPPPGDRARGPYYRWLFFGAGPVEAAVVNSVLKVQVPDDPRMRGMVGYGSLETVLDTLEDAVSRTEYLAGDRFSAADLYIGAHLGWGMQFGTIPKRPAFEAYAGKLYGRPAAVRAREIDDGLLAAQNAGAPSS